MSIYLVAENVVCIISGGNIDTNTMYRVIDKGLVKCGRRYTFNTHIDNKPGALSELTDVISRLNANILNVNLSGMDSSYGIGKQSLKVTIETFNEDHKIEIKNALIRRGFEIID